MKRLALILVFFLPLAAGAQTHKCKDAAGKITYSSQACNEIGLTSAGEVRDSVTVIPAQQQPKSEPTPTKPAASKPAASMAPGQSASAGKKDEPERRCFTVKTAKGNVTRCNDTPEENGKK